MTGQESGAEEDNHPPHIHALDVQCAKDMMTITVEFNRVFDGVIYSKVRRLQKAFDIPPLTK